MRPLVRVRNVTPYDEGRLAKDPRCWALRRAADRLAHHDDFPPPRDLHRVFDGTPPVRFVEAVPRRRRRRPGPIDVHSMYDALITLEQRVPTRPRSWHDLMNALVWGTFPRAKRALHARQYRAMAESVAPGARTLPRARTREQDALALVDEGGVVLLAQNSRALDAPHHEQRAHLRQMISSGVVCAVIFGHAIYESLVLEVAPARVAGIALLCGEPEGDFVEAADGALSRALADETRFRGPGDLLRIELDEVTLHADPSIARPLDPRIVCA